MGRRQGLSKGSVHWFGAHIQVSSRPRVGQWEGAPLEEVRGGKDAEGAAAGYPEPAGPRAAAPGRRLSRGLGAQSLSLRGSAGIPEESERYQDRERGPPSAPSLEQPSPVPPTHSPDWKVTGALWKAGQGAAGRPQHWGHCREELGQGGFQALGLLWI